MPLVPPGNQTGLYYIPVSGLPWNCTWRKLKDFARNKQPNGTGLAIEHANVYPGSTSTAGWVSVRGQADFRAAWKHLNFAEFQGRALIADDRNETQPVMLCEGVSTSASPTRSRQDSTSTNGSFSTHTNSRQQNIRHPPQYPDTNAMQESFNNWTQHQAPTPNYSPVSPSFPDGSYSQPPSPHYTPNHSFQGFVHHPDYVARPSPSIVLAGNVDPSTPLFVTPQLLPHPVYIVPVQYPPQSMLPPPPPSPQQQQYPVQPAPQLVSPAPQVITTEARKIIITGLPSTTTERDLQHLLAQVSSTSTSRYRHRNLEIARHADGRLKGHAFAIFESHHLARRAVEHLNGLLWQGRELHARFAKEGVESTPSSRESERRYAAHAAPSQTASSQYSFHSETSAGSSLSREESEPNNVDSGKGDRAEEFMTAQFAHIEIDYRVESSPSSSPSSARRDRSVLSKSSLSSEGERERGRRMRSRDQRRNTPAVVDGSSSGKRNH